MTVTIVPHRFDGTFRVPASKSHTIRALLTASCASGVSTLDYPLDSLDTRSCIAACRAAGADIKETMEGGTLRTLTITGKPPSQWDDAPKTIDAGNSGTTLFFGIAFAALGNAPVTFTGDAQLAKRSAAPLLDALAALGARVSSREGCAPITLRGPLRGGSVTLPCPTSQYLSALLLALPLAPPDMTATITVPLLNELPYIKMTLGYLKKHLAPADNVTTPSAWTVPAKIVIRGGGQYKPLNTSVTGDFSSAAFPACAGAVSGGQVTLEGLDFADEQGDKLFFELLAHRERTSPPALPGTIDLNATPDLLPIAAVLACYSAGTTRLVNVAHARIKETDRIAVMREELSKLGADIDELPDGLEIRGGRLHGGAVDGHGDHRVVMALAVAALGADGPVSIAGAQAADVTYPGFLRLLQPPRGVNGAPAV